jgi:hypothetical protein
VLISYLHLRCALFRTSPILITLFEPCVREPAKTKASDLTPSNSMNSLDTAAVGNPLAGDRREPSPLRHRLPKFTITDVTDEDEPHYAPLHTSEAASDRQARLEAQSM